MCDCDLDENKRDFSGWVMLAIVFGFWYLIYKGIQLL